MGGIIPNADATRLFTGCELYPLQVFGARQYCEGGNL